MNAPHVAARVANSSALAEKPALAELTGKRFDIDCTLDYELTGTTDFLFQIHAVDGIGQHVLSESLEITPKLPIHVYKDPAVNHRFLRLQAEAGPFKLQYRAQVCRWIEPSAEDARELPIAELPDEIMHNLMPTRYCESDHLSRAAQKLFGDLPKGYSRVKAISDWLHDNLDYQIGSTNATTTARDVFLQRAGVCRDFAHLGVTFCRALNIPARLVVGYARFEDPPPDFHAVFEAYLADRDGGRWVMFDPTQMSPVEDLVRIAMGRDAKDVAFATIFGPACMTAMNPCITAA
jgi:transglutaminase-like putative cysteine protease